MSLREGLRKWGLPAAAFAVLVGAAVMMRVAHERRSHAARTARDYLGHYGFAFSITQPTAETMRLYGAFTNPEKTSEVVFVFPKGMRDEEPFTVAEAVYGRLGIVRIEVNPNKNFPVSDGEVLAAARSAIERVLREKGEPFEFFPPSDARLPGFAVEIKGGTPLVQVFLKGSKVHYLVTAAPGTPALQEVLSSLVEVDPHDRPGT